MSFDDLANLAARVLGSHNTPSLSSFELFTDLYPYTSEIPDQFYTEAEASEWNYYGEVAKDTVVKSESNPKIPIGKVVL